MDRLLTATWAGPAAPEPPVARAAREHIRNAAQPGRVVLTGSDSVSVAAIGVDALSRGWQLAFPAGPSDLTRWPDTAYTIMVRADGRQGTLSHGNLAHRRGQWDLAMSTSGTTGRARTYGFTLQQVSGVCQLYRELYRLDSDSHIVTAMPAAHNFAFVAGVCTAAASGAALRFAASQLNVVQWLRIRPNGPRVIVLASPVLLEQEGIELAVGPNALIDSGAAPVSRPHILALRERGADIREGYGTTETLSLTHFDTEGTTDSAGTVGRTVDGVDCRLITGNRVQVRSPYSGIPLDYQLQPIDKPDSSWTSTGDIAALDRDGRLRLLGRTGDQRLAGLWPRDILDALGEVLGARTASIVTRADSLDIHLLHPLPDDMHRCVVQLATSLTGLSPHAVQIAASNNDLTYSLKLRRPPGSTKEHR